MKRNKRFLIRTIILTVLVSALIYSLYANLILKDQNQKVQAKQEAPNFVLPTLDGGTIKLSDLRGKAVLINFWGSWCEPCKREMPAIQDAYDQYKNQNFEVVTVNIREAQLTASSFINSNNLSLPVAMDKNGQVYDAYDVYSLPASFFLNPDGTVSKIYVGEMTRENLDKWVNEVLPK
ncbi:thiol-disulfide oxidoreductase ResA [Metabacillus halosaccharovorans]|uniref:thiol-disulfide oxidoreductase ResA n=1 Tax=Metabacillus halosaccharovorans TaxID=930124 RepID=UPI001C200994|nr:thiol-disulfide oxidoreductase ResA [Metabacillus halosaccharovorans]MBU7592800.1 thiol-disulfide oxidoreductase ResA [Metabacillus halosaccharovorans]